MKRRLITSALPYVNNVPHLGNLIQVLSADVFARFCRLRSYDTLYICGTDEYGTATETKAQEEGVSPRELCDRFHAIHRDIYEWFRISFDKFGRTSCQEQTDITQSIFLDLDAKGYITTQTLEQLYCDSCSRFLADRYVRGVCPSCGYDGARGDQCEHCGKLLDPTELLKPVCSTCGAQPHPKSTTHLYIDLPAIKDKLEPWIAKASVKGFWANNAVQMTQAWLRDGLKARAITRDLKWGIPVPRKGFEDKVFYVWFDAPIGYISMTAALAGEKGFDWKSWWQNPSDVELFQFIGKDNIPFHTVVFPSSLLGSGRDWTMLHHMSSSEYLNYESGKFSKSKGIGVFGTDVMETGIPADVWRFYIFWNRPETSDYVFTWADFLEKVNGELIGNLGNLANRTLTFVSRYYGGIIPEGKPDEAFWAKAREIEGRVTECLEKADLRDAFRAIFELSDAANKRFQDGEPWKTRNTDPASAASLISDLTYILRDIAILTHPYMPSASDKLADLLGFKVGLPGGTWDSLGTLTGLSTVKAPEVLFAKLDPVYVAELRERYSGSQKDRAERSSAEAQIQAAAETAVTEPMNMRFNAAVRLKVAVITKIERHPKADKLYIESLDDGSGEVRTIVSGLVPFYSEEELLGKHIILVDNLKPAKIRGVESKGMLLAASVSGSGGKEQVEVLEASWASPGTILTLADCQDSVPSKAEIDVDTFFSMPLTSRQGIAYSGDSALLADGKPIQLSRVPDGEIG